MNHRWNFLFVIFLGENWKKLELPEPPVTKLSFENTIHKIFTQKYEKSKFYPLTKIFYPFHPSKTSMDGKILSVDKSVFHGKNDG